MLLQYIDQMLTCRRHGDFIAQHDISGADFAAIDLPGGIIVRAKRGTLERYTGEETARTRVAQDLRLCVSIG